MTSYSHVIRVILNHFPNLNLVNDRDTIGVKEAPASKWWSVYLQDSGGRLCQDDEDGVIEVAVN